MSLFNAHLTMASDSLVFWYISFPQGFWLSHCGSVMLQFQCALNLDKPHTSKKPLLLCHCLCLLHQNFILINAERETQNHTSAFFISCCNHAILKEHISNISLLYVRENIQWNLHFARQAVTEWQCARRAGSRKFFSLYGSSHSCWRQEKHKATLLDNIQLLDPYIYANSTVRFCQCSSRNILKLLCVLAKLWLHFRAGLVYDFSMVQYCLKNNN